VPPKSNQPVLKPRQPDSGGPGRTGRSWNSKERRYDAAVKKYEQCPLLPARPSIYANLGFAYTELKNYAVSSKNFEKALNEALRISDLLQTRFAYEKLGREKDAIDAYEKYEKDKPSLQVTQTLAELYLSEKRSDQAMQDYRKLIRNNPKKAAWYASLGYVYGRKNDINNEIENYRHALRYDLRR
jgi:tetratricopeptide (TPR) repeat protein